MARDNDDLAKTKADGTEKTDGTYMPRGDLAKYLVEEANLDSDPPKATQFSDTSRHDQIESELEHGIIDGYSGGTFNPDDAITRAQIVKMTNLEYDLSNSSHETTFTDTDTIRDWADSYTEKGEESISGRAAEAVNLGKFLDASAKQGVAIPGPDEGIAAPFIPGSAALSGAEPDEDDFKNNDTEEA